MDPAVLKTVVIDNGSSIFKAGFVGDEIPKVIYPSIIGRHQDEPNEDIYVGFDALSNANTVKLEYPVEDGIVQDWEGMEKLWDHVFHTELKIDPTAYNAFFTEIPFNTTENRKKTIELMFERFQVPQLYLALQAVLVLYSAGRCTGLVLESGEGVSRMVPVYEGYTLPRAITQLDFGGKALTQYLAELLKARNFNASSPMLMEYVRDIKERLCYVASDFDKEMVKAKEENHCDAEYVLPDGNVITLGTERFQCPEVLFRPSLANSLDDGLAKCVCSSIKKCDIDMRRQLFATILLSGGSTLFPGYVERMKEDIALSAPNAKIVKVITPPDRQYAAWTGGSILASLTSFQQRWITKQQYEELGDVIGLLEN